MRPFAFAIVFALVSSPVWATTYRASARLDLADPAPGDGVCGYALRPAPDGTPREICTLRAAIEEANAHPGPDVIILSGGVYSLTLGGFGDVNITDDVRIEGQGPQRLSCLRWFGDDLRGCNAVPDAVPTIIRVRLRDRAFQIASRVVVSISDLTIANGSAFSGGGGAIHNAGNLTLFNVALTDNRATTGGALFNSGYANLQRTTVKNNHADGGRTACGGAITNDGQLVANRVWIEHNESTGSGGAVCNHSLAETDPPHGFAHLPTLTLYETTVTDNTAALAGGGVYTSTSALIAESLFYVNFGEDGGGLHVAHSSRPGIITSVVDTEIRANHAPGRTHPDTRRDSGGTGGGISTRGVLWVRESLIEGNISSIKGGGIAISDTGNLHLSQSLVKNNHAERDGGGVYVFGGGGNDIVHSTFSDNSARRRGGGVYLDRGTLALRYVTLAENEAERGAANIHMDSGALTLRNSIVAAGVGGPNCQLPPTGVTVTGRNIEDAADCGVGAGAFRDPLLQPLADNGGRTETYALGDGSPAIDVVPRADCDVPMPGFLLDQRGHFRPVGAGCDAGAFERDYRLPAWVADGGLIFENVLLLVTDVVATSMAISLELNGDQKGKAHGDKLLADAMALAKLIDTAIHVADPQQGLMLLATAKDALATLDQSFAAAAKCCGPVPSELATLQFASAVKRFRVALGTALGELPQPIEK
jgi:hypothetical protein